MKRFLMLCFMVLCLGTASQAVASSFGIFDSSKSLEENLAANYPDVTFINGFPVAILNQGFYFQAIFAADNMIGADSKFFTVGNSEHSFADLPNTWATNNPLENIANMTVSYNGQSFTFADIVSGMSLYVDGGMEYTPEAGLDAMLVEGGTFFVSFSIPGSSNAVDFIFAISSNPIGFEPAHAPAPAALLLFGTGLVGIVATRRRVKN